MEKNDIIIIHGTDYKNMAKRVLEQAGVAADIGDVNKKIALKTQSGNCQGALQRSHHPQ